MIDRDHPLPITKQCRILNLSRSGIYYAPVPASGRDMELMRIMDKAHLDHPCLV